MQTDVYHIDGKIAGKLELPHVFNTPFRPEIVKRALLAEQSMRYQPQGHFVLAGMQTTAAYIGKMNAYRSGRHMGIAIRPRQKLGGGAMGDVRRIPSSVKGKRAHPHMVEKRLSEQINDKEYRLAIESAIGGASSNALRERLGSKMQLPVIIEDKIEGIAKSKELMGIFKSMGMLPDVEKSHKPRLRKGLTASKSRIRHYRKSVLIIVKNASNIERAGRNIPGIDVCSISSLSIEKLAPGGNPRLILWSESAAKEVEGAISKARL